MDEYNGHNPNEEQKSEKIDEPAVKEQEINKESNEQSEQSEQKSQQAAPVYQSYQSYQSYNVKDTNPTVNAEQPQNTYYYVQQPAAPQQPYEQMNSPTPKKQNDTFGIISLCCALSFVVLIMCCCCCAPLAGVFLSLVFACEVAAIVFAFVSKQKMGKFTGMAIAGLILAIVIIILMVSIFGVIVVEYTLNPDYYNDFFRALSEPGYYVEFFEEHEPEFYRENKEEVDEYFEDIFDAMEEQSAN